MKGLKELKVIFNREDYMVKKSFVYVFLSVFINLYLKKIVNFIGEENFIYCEGRYLVFESVSSV